MTTAALHHAYVGLLFYPF